MSETLGTTYGLKKRHAAYTPGVPRPICPACFSRPDLDWGSERQIAGDKTKTRAKQGFGELTLVEPLRIITDGGPRTFSVTDSLYRCSNPECKTAVVVRACLGISPIYIPDLVLHYQVADDAAERYAKGHHTKAGVFVGDAPPPEPEPEPVQKPKRVRKKSNPRAKTNTQRVPTSRAKANA